MSSTPFGSAIFLYKMLFLDPVPYTDTGITEHTEKNPAIYHMLVRSRYILFIYPPYGPRLALTPLGIPPTAVLDSYQHPLDVFLRLIAHSPPLAQVVLAPAGGAFARANSYRFHDHGGPGADRAETRDPRVWGVG